MVSDLKQSFWRPIWTGYVFWTLLTSLPALIWFYPLNELEISGYETFVTILFSPIFLRFQCVRRFLQSNTGDLALKILCMIGVYSFRAPSTLIRLFLLTLGNGGAILKFSCDLTTDDVGKRKYAFWGYALGFMAVVCTRTWYRSIMPAFHDSTSNLLVFWITFLNTLATLVSFEPSNPSASSSGEKDSTNAKSTPNFVMVACGAGSLIYVMHSIFGEISTPCRWINGPYPNVGPQPLPWSLLVYVALIVGFYLSDQPRLVFSPIYAAISSAAFFVMYYAHGWPGFVGSLMLATYTTSLFPTYMDLLFRRTPANRVGPCLALVMLVYVLEVLFGVWTVAYNFVPGGEYTRERTGILIGVCTTAIALGLYWHGGGGDADGRREQQKHLAFSSVSNAARITKSKVCWRLVLFGLFATAGISWRMNEWSPGRDLEGRGEIKNFTGMIWTYHFGYDNRGWPSMERTARLIRDVQADVIGLLETDASRAYMGNNDLAQWLAENLQMYVDFGPNTRKHTWGSMLLSKFPILHSEHHLLPSPRGELAPAISAVLNVSGVEVGVVVTHFGNDVDDEDRKLQAQSIARITADFDRRKIPSLFLGYVTSKPRSRDYFTLLDQGRMLDVDESDQDRFCEYIFYNRLNRISYARISHGGLSDTEIQAAKFLVPESNARKVDTFSDEYHRLVTNEKDKAVTEAQRMSERFGGFYGGHYRGEDHHYHMFTPKYFVA